MRVDFRKSEGRLSNFGRFPVFVTSKQRQFNPETAALPFLAGDTDIGTMGRADGFHDGKAEPRSAGTSGTRFVDSIEAFENMSNRIGRNSRAVIGDSEYGFSVLSLDFDFDRAALLRVLDGVVDEIRNHLLQACAIALDINAILCGSTQRDRLLLREDSHFELAAEMTRALRSRWIRSSSTALGLGSKRRDDVYGRRPGTSTTRGSPVWSLDATRTAKAFVSQRRLP
jgi:hypothetical protein